MKINETLYNNLLKSINRTIKNVLFEYEEYSNKDYVIKEYNKSNQEDFNYVSINRKQIWEFFDNGYKAAGLNGFCNSCFNPDSLRKNFNKIKLVYYNDDIIIAGAIYTGRHNGYKCVGITATTNETYRALGKDAVKYIIKQDIGSYKDFYWGVFDGAVSHYYEKFGGILIPNDYCHLFIDNAKPDINDEYNIIIKLSDGTDVVKLIYGFNSKETFDEIMKMADMRVDKQVNRLNQMLKDSQKEKSELKESIKKLNYNISIEEYHVRIINMFYDDFLNGHRTLTPHMTSLINKSKEFLIKYLKSNKNIQNKDYYELAIENAKDILKYSTKMKLYKF